MLQIEVSHTHLIDPNYTNDPKDDFVGGGYGEEHNKILLRKNLYEGSGPSLAIGY